MGDRAFVEGEEEFVDELKHGTKLMHGQYTIDCFLAVGGFGITYLATDSLDRYVVIKECFPGSFCRRYKDNVAPRSRAHQSELKSIVRLFSQEARSLAKAGHPNIVGVHQVFEENNTAYMALDYVQGHDLLEILTSDPAHLQPDLVQGYLVKILGAVGHVHSKGMLHRDISPDNIIIREDGEPVLIDFGAARDETDGTASRTLSALRVVKEGYSPQEFYTSGSDQDPSSDLYSLAACFYHVITGTLPCDAQARLAAIASEADDPYVPLATIADGYPEEFCEALDKAMSVSPEDRMQSADEWLDHLNFDAPIFDGYSAGDTEMAIMETPARKSPLPLLVGTVAVAAAVGIGFGYVLLSKADNEDQVGRTTLPPDASAIVALTEATELPQSHVTASRAWTAAEIEDIGDIPREAIKLASVAAGTDLDAVRNSTASASLADEIVAGNTDKPVILATNLGAENAVSVVERQLPTNSETQTVLSNGLVFVASKVDGKLVTKVAAAPAGSNFQIGDTIVAFVDTAERLDETTSLKSIIERELKAGKTSFSFAIDRRGEVWVEDFSLAALIQ